MAHAVRVRVVLPLFVAGALAAPPSTSTLSPTLSELTAWKPLFSTMVSLVVSIVTSLPLALVIVRVLPLMLLIVPAAMCCATIFLAAAAGLALRALRAASTPQRPCATTRALIVSAVPVLRPATATALPVWMSLN